MRNWIIGAAALLALAAPGVAAAQSGYVGAVYSNTDVDGFDESDAYGAEGAVAFAGSGSIVFEIDAAVLDSEDSDTGYGVTGHIYARNDSHLFGGFVGIADSDDSTTWTAGLEASKFFTDWTLAGALFYANNDDANADGYGVNAEARFFVHDNFRLQGNLGWATIDTSFGDDDAYSYGVGGEYQFAAVPVSLALGYMRTELDEADFESDTISAAIRYNWGGTLRDRDRNGASQASITRGFSF
jgi:hypothetical protein